MVQVPFAHEDIDCPHRIGMEYTEKNPGTKVKSIIVKFKSRRVWKRFKDARPKNFQDHTKKRGYKSISVCWFNKKAHLGTSTVKTSFIIW